MARMIEKDKWILYKHTNNYEMIQAVALDVKTSCKSSIGDAERHGMQDRLAMLDFYKTRNVAHKPLDAINHRINTLEFYMFGYEDNDNGRKRFIFSPLGNLYLKYITDVDKLRKIFLSMLFGIQFQHPANGTPATFQLYPFRLLLKLMTEERLDYKLYNSEYTYIIAFQNSINIDSYDSLVDKILDFRKLPASKVADLMKEDEHVYVNCIYEWQYYTQKLLEAAGVVSLTEGEPIVKLFHPTKSNSKSAPTGRTLTSGYVTISYELKDFAIKLLNEYSCFDKPLHLNDPERMKLDVVKDIYSFYPRLLLSEIGETNELEVRLLELPKLIEKYSENPDNGTAYMFEDVLTEGFNMFVNIEARKVGGAGNTDIECLYLTRRKKIAVEAKSTANKLSGINASRLKEHRSHIGAEYTIVITPRYVPAAKRDIDGHPIVIVLASTFSEYLYNHVYHNIRSIDYEDFDNIIVNNHGKDISRLISEKTMEKFATSAL